MNKQEFSEVQEQFYDVYCGILFGLQVWQKGEDTATVCRLDCPELEELKTRYPIERAAGRGGAFARALRLCRYLAPRLKHESMYDNHVPCNALAARNMANGTNPYYAKNMAFFVVELKSAFGAGGKAAHLVPCGVDVTARELQNIRYRMQWAEKEGLAEYLAQMKEWYARAEKETPRLLSEEGYLAPPNAEKGRD